MVHYLNSHPIDPRFLDLMVEQAILSLTCGIFSPDVKRIQIPAFLQLHDLLHLLLPDPGDLGFRRFLILRILMISQELLV
jgi:hypothetical protein